jgi:predicted phage-related endonuclease
LKLLFPRSKASKSIEAPKELSELIIQLKAIQSQVASHEEKMSEIKQALMGHMQDAEVLTYQGQVLATWKAPKASTRIDTKKLALEHPEMIAAYQTEVANSRRLVIKGLQTSDK